MKKLVIATAIILSMSMSVNAKAEREDGLNGLLIGAGSGAIMGQAIGRNTEATVIGSAVGGVLGYIIGSEINDNRGSRYRQPQHHTHGVPGNRKPVKIVKKTIINEYHHYPSRSSVHNDHRSQCREAEILGKVNGRPKRIYGTVCRTRGGWELIDPEPKGTMNRSRYDHAYPSHHDHGHKKVPRRHMDWVEHRF